MTTRAIYTLVLSAATIMGIAIIVSAFIITKGADDEVNTYDSHSQPSVLRTLESAGASDPLAAYDEAYYYLCVTAHDDDRERSNIRAGALLAIRHLDPEQTRLREAIDEGRAIAALIRC